MTIEVRIENRDTDRTITVRDEEHDIPGRSAKRSPQFVRLGPGQVAAFHVHAAKSLHIVEVPE